MDPEDVLTQDEDTHPPVTPGYKTSEFYTTLVSKVFAILVTLSVVSSSDADAYTKGISGVVAGIFVIASTYLAAHYTTRRTQVKTGGGLSIFLLLCLPAGAADVRDCTVRVSVPPLRGQNHGRGGSAVFIGFDQGRYLLSTAAHVVAGHQQATVLLSSGQAVQAAVNHCDDFNDLALMTFASRELFPIAGLGEDAKPGDAVWQVGYPNDQQARRQVLLMTTGRSRGVVAGKFYGDVIIKSGDSGGGFFDSQSRLVAVSCASQGTSEHDIRTTGGVAVGPSASVIRQACNGIGVGGWAGISGSPFG